MDPQIHHHRRHTGIGGKSPIDRVNNASGKNVGTQFLSLEELGGAASVVPHRLLRPLVAACLAASNLTGLGEDRVQVSDAGQVVKVGGHLQDPVLLVLPQYA